MSETIQKGGISVETKHIFPIIKQWLYSEKEIFLREIVSNACDAVTKRRRLYSLGQIDSDLAEPRITVTADPIEKTLTVSDCGIGMSEEELKKYICQIALSGAVDFINQYEGKDGEGSGIIGHFGLGFYSAFMVADTVEVITRSYTGAEAVHFVCGEEGEYEIRPDAVREQVGTDVILHITEDCEEYLQESKLRAILDKYCAFLPVPLYLTVLSSEEAKEEETKEEQTEPTPINDIAPLWTKAPSDCTDEEYLSFYRKVFSDYREPLFHIHVSADYPVSFKGILYFPRMGNEYESPEGQIKLYYNQVYVADNIKEVLPEYLFMMKGVLDCPELPLNVSRSYLQNSVAVQKISAHIAKKVADKLVAMMNGDREKYESIWGEGRTFVQYACLRDGKFYDRVKSALLLPIVGGGHLTVEEYREKTKDKQENTFFYCSDPAAQAGYIAMLQAQDIPVILFDRMLDTQFMSHLEQKEQIRFLRVDSELSDVLKGEGEAEENEALVSLFRAAAGKEEMKVQMAVLKDEAVPALLTTDEQSRRFSDMMRLYGGEGVPREDGEMTLVLNTASPLIARLSKQTEEATAKQVAKQIYTLALLSRRPLNAEEMKEFLADSYELLKERLS